MEAKQEMQLFEQLRQDINRSFEKLEKTITTMSSEAKDYAVKITKLEGEINLVTEKTKTLDNLFMMMAEKNNDQHQQFYDRFIDQAKDYQNRIAELKEIMQTQHDMQRAAYETKFTASEKSLEVKLKSITDELSKQGKLMVKYSGIAVGAIAVIGLIAKLSGIL